MAIIKNPYPVKLIAGIITSSEEGFKHAERALRKAFGSIDYKSHQMVFNSTDYYNEEMGEGLKRTFLSFNKLIDPKALANIKIITNKIENSIARCIKAVKRPVNIDPGYIDAAKLILASAKDYSHRIYLQKGIYAEIELFYCDGNFKAREWTYPDYRTREYIEIFNEIRKLFMEQRA